MAEPITNPNPNPTPNPDPTPNPNPTPAAFNFDEWSKSADKALVEGINSHITGLKSALDSERTSVKDLKKQITDLAAKAEKGSETEKQLNSLTEKIGEHERKTEFYEAAAAAGCTNMRLAYLAAVDGEMFKKNGSPDMDAVKQKHPELFGAKTAPKVDAGRSTDGNPSPGSDMNAMIRRAAGRQ